MTVSLHYVNDNKPINARCVHCTVSLWMKFPGHCQNSSRSRSRFWLIRHTPHTMVTSTSGALKNISNSLRKYLHKHPKIIFRINMEQGFHDSWLLSLSWVSCLSESRSLTPLCANFDNRINPRYLCWFLFALVFRNTHTKYWNIFCVFKTTSSLYVFRIENQLNKHCEKTFEKKWHW